MSKKKKKTSQKKKNHKKKEELRSDVKNQNQEMIHTAEDKSEYAYETPQWRERTYAHDTSQSTTEEQEYDDGGDNNTIYVSHGQHAPCRSPQLRQKVKKLTSALILIGGFACGSLFVDVAQFFTERGLSARAMDEARVVAYDGATWVKYDEPKTVAHVFVSNTYGEEVLTRLDSIISTLAFFMPTLEFRRVDTGQEKGRDIAQDFDIAYAPAIHFSEELNRTAYYAHASELFTPREDGSYVLHMNAVEMPLVEYLAQPQTKKGVIVGAEKYDHEIVMYGNFSCVTCGQVFAKIESLQDVHQEKYKAVYKNIPSDGDEASDAGIYAGQCAYEQGHYSALAQILFSQNEWKDVKPLAREKLLRTYLASVPEVDADQFMKCFEDRKYDKQRVMDINEADRIGIISFPTIFIDGILVKPQTSEETISAALERIAGDLRVEAGGVRTEQ